MKNLTAYNSQNDREIGMMMGKAMCAYANFLNAKEHEEHEFKYQPKEVVVQKHLSEYEATVRCIGMFVKESIYEIQLAVTDSCKEEFGV